MRHFVLSHSNTCMNIEISRPLGPVPEMFHYAAPIPRAYSITNTTMVKWKSCPKRGEPIASFN